MHHHVNHPVIDDCMIKLRDELTTTDSFRANLQLVSQIIAFEVTRDIPTIDHPVNTPLETCLCKKLSQPVTIVPILRAGLGMLDGFLSLLPEASVAHIGMERNEDSLQPRKYYFKAPDDITDSFVIIIDPMLATGGTAAATLSELKKSGATNIRFACVLAAPEGLSFLNNEHPDVPIYFGTLDRCLNENGYILPGLGDAGDRYFGT